MLDKELTYLDLFSGTGGFALGLKQAGFKFKKHYFSEIDKYAIGNYQHNFKNSIHVGEIEKIKTKKIERPNIITFGSPCQDISVASNGKGLQGQKSKLFFRAIEVIKWLKPDCFVFENVRNLFSSNEGKDFETVLRSISEIGLYDCQWQLLNSSLLLPQNRERIYLVGHLTTKSPPQVFPIQISTAKTQEIKERQKLNVVGRVYKSLQAGKVYSPMGKAPTLTTDSSGLFIQTKASIRKLTPIELERLQGFPDNWTRHAIVGGETIELSDTQRSKLMGNAVSPNLVTLVTTCLKATKSLNGVKQNKKSTPMRKRNTELKIPEITLKLDKKSAVNLNQITDSFSAAEVFRSMYDPKDLQLRESFFVLFLSRSNVPVGFYRHSTGGIEATIADAKLIMASALKAAASGIIVAHNHPSGTARPSESDKKMTKKLREASEFLDISFLDSLIITKNKHYSFADDGLMGVENKYPLTIPNTVINEMKSKLKKQEKTNLRNQKVEALSDELKFIQRYINLNGKVKTQNQIRLFINALQKSIRQKRIRKTSKFANEIQVIQKSLIELFENFKSASHKALVKVPEKRLRDFKEILRKIEELESIKLIQSYINIQGKLIQVSKAKNLLNRIEKAINSGRIHKGEKQFDTLERVKKTLKSFINDKRIGKVFLPVLSQNLSGLVTQNSSLSVIPKDQVMNSMDIMALKFDTLNFKGKWKDFIGNPSPGFTTMIFGRPKMGKSFLSIDFASYLAKNHGRVLYIAAEEQISAILQDKLRQQNAAHPNLDTVGSLPSNLSDYDFVFIDSVNHYNLTVEDLRLLKEQYPSTSFIYIFQTTKSGLFRGSNEFQHDVDVVIEIPEKGIAVQYGRFNAGSEMKIFKNRIE